MSDVFAIFCVPVIYLASLLFVPNGAWKLGAKLKSNNSIPKSMKEAQAKELSKISEMFISAIADKKNLNLNGQYQLQKIQNAINYTINRHDWYEAQRSAVLTKLMTVCGLAFTAMGLYISTQNGALLPEIKLLIVSIGISLLIAILYGVHLYNSELDQDRPYRLVSDIRYWYYRYSLPDKVEDYGERGDYTNIANEVLKQRGNFFERALQVSKLDDSLREDLEQLFILHVLVKHKSTSLQKLRWTFFSLVILLSTSAVWYFVYFNFIRP